MTIYKYSPVILGLLIFFLCFVGVFAQSNTSSDVCTEADFSDDGIVNTADFFAYFRPDVNKYDLDNDGSAEMGTDTNLGDDFVIFRSCLSTNPTDECLSSDFSGDGIVNTADFFGYFRPDVEKYDLDNDGIVEAGPAENPGDDYNIYLSCFGSAPTGDCLKADFSGDGIVNTADFFGYFRPAINKYDLDGDENIEFGKDITLGDDFVILQSCFSTSPTSECLKADFSGDGIVNTADFFGYFRPDVNKYDLDNDGSAEMGTDSNPGDDFNLLLSCFTTSSESSNLSVSSQQIPVINSVVPNLAKAGDTITVNGQYFNNNSYLEIVGQNQSLFPYAYTNSLLRFNITSSVKVGLHNIRIRETASDVLSNSSLLTIIQNTDKVQLISPNGGSLTWGESSNFSWVGGKNTVNIGIVKDNFVAGASTGILGWISTTESPNSSLIWDGKTVCDLIGTTCWDVKGLYAGPFKAIASSEDANGNYCLWSASSGCDNWDLSDQSFSINYVLKDPPPPAPVTTPLPSTQITPIQVAPPVSPVPVSVAPITTTTNQSYKKLTRQMRIGSRSSEVTRLQELLAKDSSLYPQKIVSGYYGQLTEAAIKKFQCRYNVVCNGDRNSTGYGVVGPKTLSKLNDVYETTVATTTTPPPTTSQTTTPTSSGSSGLSQAQIDSIIGLLEAFGADASTVANVRAQL